MKAIATRQLEVQLNIYGNFSFLLFVDNQSWAGIGKFQSRLPNQSTARDGVLINAQSQSQAKCINTCSSHSHHFGFSSNNDAPKRMNSQVFYAFKEL